MPVGIFGRSASVCAPLSVIIFSPRPYFWSGCTLLRIASSAFANSSAVAKRLSRLFSSDFMMIASSCGGTLASGFVWTIGAGFSVTCLRM